MVSVNRLVEAIREEGLSGWLISNNHHRDEIADLLLGVSRERTNTRPWVCLVLAEGEPVKIVHAMESEILEQVPGRTVPYSTRAEFVWALGEALPRGLPLAADFSVNTPVASFLDHGTALLVQSLGASLVSAEALIARTLGTIDERGFESHQAAAAVLYRTVSQVWSRLGHEVARGRAVSEGELRDWIQKELTDAGLVSDSPPIVAGGPHSGNPHFEPRGPGSPLQAGEVVQFDLWARLPSEGSVYADISWVGVLSARPSPAQEKTFQAVVAAREAAIQFIEQGLAERRTVRGAEVDRVTRDVLQSLGFAAGLRHRTGHSIGGRVHGFGANLDSVEFPDRRVLREGACFSVEPGVYGQEFGMRSEVDCCIQGGRLVVSGGERQRALLLLS